MSSSLFSRPNKMDLFKLIQSGNPQEVYNHLMQTNSQFRNFVEQNKGKTPEQIAMENGIDINMLQQFMNK